MRNLKYCFLFLLLFLVDYARAGEACYIVYPKSQSDFIRLTELCSVDGVNKNGAVRIYIEKSRIDEISCLVNVMLPVNTSPDPLKVKISDNIMDFSDTWDSYPTFDQFVELMESYPVKYPDLCRLDTIGWSVVGRPLLMMEITSGIGNKADKPQFNYQSTMHGNECVPYILNTRLIDHFLKSYNTESVEGARISRIIDSVDLFVMPLMNPDGAYAGGNNTIMNAQRYNMNNEDLNRNFPDRVKDANNATQGREPETAAIMDWVRNHHIVLSANFHTGALVANYPWDGRADGRTPPADENCPDSLWFEKLSLCYSENNPEMYNSGEFDRGITIGAAWYTVYGGRQDWIYHFHQGREVTLEISDDGIPPGDELPGYWERNRESMIKYIEQSLNGIRGTVKDEDGNPLLARIHLLEIPETDVFTDSAVGSFFRYVDTGIFNMIVSSDGFISDTITDIHADFNTSVRYDIILRKSTSDVAFKTRNMEKPILSAYPNPASDYIIIESPNMAISPMDIEIYDSFGKQSAIHYLMNDYSRKIIDITGLPPGLYITRVKSGGDYTRVNFIICR